MKFENTKDWSIWVGGDEVLQVNTVEVFEGKTVITLDGAMDSIAKDWTRTAHSGASAVFTYGRGIRNDIKRLLVGRDEELHERVVALERRCAEQALIISAFEGELK